ncbi:MAG: DUF4157 domain-containing protein, partial [Acidobacteriota bacterium]|nr:DUF4157 domain-containing protein [Acidobacteriota bacterium]
MIAKAKGNADPFKTSDPQRSSLVKHQGSGAADHALMLQRTIGNQAVLRLFAQQARGREQESGPAGRKPTSGQLWDFSKIPLFLPDRASRPQASSPLTVFPLPGRIQPKLVVGEVNDPLESEADRAAEHVMRMPDPAAITAPSGDMVLQRKCEACEGEEKEDPPKLARAESHDASSFDGSTAPAIMQEVLSSPGRALEPSTRAFFEPRFGHDFSRVRVHTDLQAAESAQSVGALAYAVGRDIVFGSSQYSQHASPGG